jgi:hypothetical protein
MKMGKACGEHSWNINDDVKSTKKVKIRRIWPWPLWWWFAFAPFVPEMESTGIKRRKWWGMGNGHSLNICWNILVAGSPLNLSILWWDALTWKMEEISSASYRCIQ